jgi:hypothetical protein
MSSGTRSKKSTTAIQTAQAVAPAQTTGKDLEGKGKTSRDM